MNLNDEDNNEEAAEGNAGAWRSMLDTARKFIEPVREMWKGEEVQNWQGWESHQSDI